MKVGMIPRLHDFGREENGIKRVVEAYEKYMPEFDIQYVARDASFDVAAIHAGMSEPVLRNINIVSHLHGLYWTADYADSSWERKANRNVIESARLARQITVPSTWVAENIARDLRVYPHVVPHGIEPELWANRHEPLGYVLWNKNRAGDVCDPTPMAQLAGRHTDIRFVSTFAPRIHSSNITITGVKPHQMMRTMIQQASVYLSTTKETFGIGVLEALASGVPVLGFKYGGNVDLIEHGVTGYLARPGDIDDLSRGLEYCMRYRDVLSANAVQAAKKWSWRNAAQKVAEVYRLAAAPEEADVSIIIPSYNYGKEDKVGRAIQSAIKQSYPLVKNIIVVDDGSTDDGATEKIVAKYHDIDPRVRYVRQDNQGVAEARNHGISMVDTKYVCCLDADDAIEPDFVRACIPPLEEDRSLGVAYTGLFYIRPSGKSGLSEWPGEYNYDEQVKMNNQIPTCCVFRREMWRRLGGYRQRYAPGGAGAEDAEFWLRAGAYGWGAKKATDAGLFIYSWLTGYVSGDPNYQEVDYSLYHPWTKDGLHPFPSVATPKSFSHLVRQYDEPIVSVIIPVGNGHEKELINALDSLEAQTFRKWEAIVVVDTDSQRIASYLEAYPYVRAFFTGGKKGAGYARNLGARHARGNFLLFLDADDNLYPEAITEMLDRWSVSKAIIYSDYVGKAYMDKADAKKLGSRLLHYDDHSRQAVIEHHSSEYDCEKAVVQPDKSMYIWNLITSLVPKIWHEEIGGFDTTMPSWEDWDYWIRMARAGKCFSRILKPLVVYRFYTGERRERGLHDAQSLIQYLLDKYERIEPMPCHCGGNGAGGVNVQRVEAPRAARKEERSMPSNIRDTDVILCLYDHPNRGQHKVIGASTGTSYGYRGGGEQFYVHVADARAQPQIYKPIIAEAPPQAEVAETPPPKPISEPEPIPEGIEAIPSDENFDLQSLPGVSTQIAISLNAIGVYSLEDLLKLDVEKLTQVKGIGRLRAEKILEVAAERIKASESGQPA